MSDELVVYVKASPDGHHRGSCPYSQSVVMWLQLKKVPHTEFFIDLKDKPDWFLDMYHAGTTPVLKFNDKIIGDSEAILDFLEDRFPEPDLTSRDVAFDVCPNLMQAFEAYTKNDNPRDEAKLKRAFDDQMVNLHEYLDSTKHKFLSANYLTRADCVLAPKLYIALTELENSKKYKIPMDAPLAKEYVDRTFSSTEFRGSACNKDYVLQSYAKPHDLGDHQRHHKHRK
eukprot:m.51456 g.51456  ORF g.51456 m.51456 type:complete len:228 (+) comp12625_c0_seq1:605-1288(+)